MTEPRDPHPYIVAISQALGGIVVSQVHDSVEIAVPPDQKAKVERITKLLLEDVDPYTAMAAGVFEVELAEVTQIQRAAMKQRLFRFLYGAD